MLLSFVEIVFSLQILYFVATKRVRVSFLENIHDGNPVKVCKASMKAAQEGHCFLFPHTRDSEVLQRRHGGDGLQHRSCPSQGCDNDTPPSLCPHAPFANNNWHREPSFSPCPHAHRLEPFLWSTSPSFLCVFVELVASHSIEFVNRLSKHKVASFFEVSTFFLTPKKRKKNYLPSR